MGDSIDEAHDGSSGLAWLMTRIVAGVDDMSVPTGANEFSVDIML